MMELSTLNSVLPLTNSDLIILKAKLQSNRLWIVKITLSGIFMCFLIPLIPSRYPSHNISNGSESYYWTKFVFISIFVLLAMGLIAIGVILKGRKIKKDLESNTKLCLVISNDETKERRIDMFEKSAQNMGFTKTDILKVKNFLYTLEGGKTALISYCYNSKLLLSFSSE